MVTVQMSPEVQRMLGPEGMAQARREAQNADCATCTKKITGRANVVVTGAKSMQVRVWFTHPACKASTVTELRKPSRNPTDTMRMSSLPPLPGGHGRAVLVAQLESPQYYADTPQTELTDRLAPYLLSQGFEPIGDTATEPPLLDRWVAVPSQVPGTETGGSLLTILDDNAEVFFTGPVFTPARWRRTALETGECTLYYGPTELDPASRDFPTQNRLLENAVRDGRLLAARVPCMDRATLQDTAARE
ncbi:hypothetical protein [Streptomyces noursei]|uniref:hypothetical protein n=1 Tax=Streptomyces noursei TaxID=1971 RepID=UPI00167A0C1E|nr:hypothetical protein [Streptomyces noursei]MCZ1021097.1 hypothetical protein [Streptomyces noursei]MCZ1021128.1 hypothetical protein [Streptomyces noursei]